MDHETFRKELIRSLRKTEGWCRHYESWGTGTLRTLAHKKAGVHANWLDTGRYRRTAVIYSTGSRKPLVTVPEVLVARCCNRIADREKETLEEEELATWTHNLREFLAGFQGF